MKKYSHKFNYKSDGDGQEVIESVLKRYPDCELFVCGPVTSIGKYIKSNPSHGFKYATMQGGYLGENPNWMPTFNFNGDRKRAVDFINSTIPNKRFVGKNICHKMLYNKEIHKRLQVKDLASELFKEFGDLYFKHHKDKKFHDPTAAVCHLHPEIGDWVRGTPTKMESGWGTVLHPQGSQILSGINEEKLWNHITNFN